MHRLIQKNSCSTVLEAHSGISALIVEKSDYDAIWVSSLTNSASKGLPDTELVPLNSRINLVKEIRRVADKPIIVDVDTGGQTRHLPYYVKWFENVGANALVIEDKKFPKENSLDELARHKLEDVDKFCEKIRVAKKAAKEIWIVARIESLIAKHSMKEAITRADEYVKAGVDAILIHSKVKVNADEVMEFAQIFRDIHPNVPLVAIPTNYTLPANHQFNITIYANQLFRASVKAMEETAERIEDKNMKSVQDVFKMIGQ